MNGGNFAYAVGPIPMRKDVRHRKVRTPARLVNIETVFLETGEVDNAERIQKFKLISDALR